MPVVISQGQIF